MTDLWILGAHICLASFTLVMMLAGLLWGGLFWYKERALRGKQWDSLSLRLPSLMASERIVRALLQFGFVFLTIVFGTGLFLSDVEEISFSWRLIHLGVAVVCWGVYAVAVSRRLTGLHGKKILGLSLLGFVSLMSLFLWSS